MNITFDNEKYFITCEYGERNQIKAAGFKWCSQNKMWGTNSFYIAMMAVKKLNIEEYPNELKSYLDRYRRSYTQEPFLSKGKPELFEYQNAGVDEMMFRRNVLLADEQGLGKTLQVITYASIIPQLTKTIIICPASLKLNWAREFKKWADMDTFVVRTGKDRFPKDASTIIVNYDLLKSKLINDQLIAFKATLLVCDEAHYLKNAKTQRTKAVGKLARVVPKKIFLTGTPLLNRPVELYPLIKMLAPHALTPYQDYRNYAYRFCNAYNSKWGLDVSGNSNVEELGVRLRATCMVRRLKKDVMKQLPDKTIQLIPFELCKKTEKIIEREEWFFIEDLKKYPERGSMGELAQIRHELAVAKIDESARYITDLLHSIDKVVIFAHHYDVINGIKDKLQEFNPVVITGKHVMKNRQKAVDDFQTKEDVRVFIGQIQAAGTGLTLTAASTVVFAETSWVPGEINQAIDRCHRIGQKDNVTAKFLVVEKSLDETMLKTIFDKEKTINRLLK
jgi:SWI/SNF-related matrix-associated actin-dependent regulator 1 of chromatin subfamily A